MATRRSLPGWLLGVAAFVVGVVVLAVGLGLGPRHAAKEGFTATTALGLGTLAVGLAVVVAAAAWLLRSTRKRAWFATVPLLLVTAYVGCFSIGFAVAAAFPPRPELGSRTPAAVGLDFRPVTFAAADGVTLAGWYLPSGNGEAVAVLHGAGSTRSAALGHAAVLNRAGYGVLLYDARGHGRSAGRGMELGWWGDPDCRGAVDFLLRQPDVSAARVGLLGLSMGGEQAIGAAGADRRVAVVVAEGATTRVSEDFGYLDRYGVRGQLQQGLNWLTSAVTQALTPAPRPPALRDSVVEAAGRALPTQFLLVTAGDVPDEGHAARFIQDGAPSAVEIWTVRGAGHTGGLRTAPDEWTQRVLGFLDSSLAAEG